MTQYTQSPPAQYAELFRNLSIDNQLALLWYLYIKMGGSTRPGDPEGTAPDTSEGLFNKVKGKSHEEQLQIMRDLLTPSSTDIRREYDSLSNNTKLAFWYRLAQGMENSTIVQVPSDYQLSAQAKELLSMLEPIDFELQYAFLRDALLAGY
ncbi:orange carotenoid protein N-terminal domain-containing protein [Brasilonema sp. UFV-L1]|uniref:orange carotenoid protein N-terminal domain-containing protein n=1 Tax=Brasilonema sp. UFV-L1 TaxID=2234130 RepID=UPI00145D4C6E|nr:orange carotenoid protein N-terminal domain-containing protein [Brasilonema sp. UFV-L1]NMG06170.1 Orange carotenoid protein [Brasilonema sp. UFV-L1]